MGRGLKTISSVRIPRSTLRVRKIVATDLGVPITEATVITDKVMKAFVVSEFENVTKQKRRKR